MNKNRQLEIEKLADYVRDECKVTDYGIQNIFDAADKLKYRVIRLPIGEDLFLGFSLIKESERIIFSNSSLILSREIFTVAHEIGHHKLHLSEQGVTMIKDNDFNNNDGKEIEANYFAACLLMPKEKVEKFIRFELDDKEIYRWNGLDIARIQTTFYVSYDMVLNRLDSLNILNSDLKEKLIMEKFENKVTRLLKTINGNIDLCKPSNVENIPAEYIEWVITNYNNKLISLESLEKAISYIGLTSDDLENLSEEDGEDDENIEDLLGRIE
ncbi:MAG: ImmA/IrrE family metallo-endopeptidase [Bacillota bacterium]